MHTVKGLVGVAPNGVITFVSQLYPGSTSDKKNFNACGLKQKLLPGDVVMADKGFLIKNDLPPGVNLVLPPFLKAPQFSADEVIQTNSIAKARVHIERANSRLKNFHILDKMPYEYFSMCSKNFQVCGALCNMQRPLIRAVQDSYRDSDLSE